MYGPKDNTNPASSASDVTVRLARPEDAPALQGLAALDSTSAPAGPAVVAEVGGRLVAALPLGGGPAIADPFHRTAALVQILELRAGHLRAAAPARSGLRRRARGLARAVLAH